ncbi:MAG: hypothetical protein EBX40_07690, partial [Gammaproteobacteria bacterium]|nr:hypothetical protein [Gammaproteobacteria bacterium]
KLETLILASRRATENQEYTDTAGIPDEEFIQYFNDGQEEIQSLINQSFPRVMMKQGLISTVANQEAYDLPSDIYLGTRLDFAEYSTTGDEQNYYPLKQGSLKERLNGIQSNPSFYIRNNSQILLQPRPQKSGAVVRVTYQRTIPRLDIVRGTVLSATLDTGNKTITSLQLDTGSLLDSEALLEENYITILDKNGVVKMQAIPISAIASNGVVSVDAGFVYSNGESITAGDKVCRGKYASNFSQLPDVCEKYILEYTNTRILIRDSSSDAGDVGQILAKVQNTLQAAFAETDNDPKYPTILDGQFLGWDVF